MIFSIVHKTKHILIFFLACSTLICCTDPYSLDSEQFEEQIVINATISNRLERQAIKVSKTYPLDSTTYLPASNGLNVKVKEEQGTEYFFSYRAEDSTFVSDQAFQALPNTNYTLEITTPNDVYKATSSFKNPIDIDSLTVKKATDDKGEEGLEVAVNSAAASNNNNYFRFEYENTYKITAPYYSPFKAVIQVTENPNPLGEDEEIVRQVFDPNIYHEKCYVSENSIRPILASTENYTAPNLIDFPIKFIPKTDYRINERYSIKVTQYAQSLEAYTFYKTLETLSSEGDILSPNQPGFIEGNIQSVNYPNKNVIGFFEVAAVDSKRLYFKHQDFFPEDAIPPYFKECEPTIFDKTDMEPGADGPRLIQYVHYNTYYLFKAVGYLSDEIGYKDFYMVKPECGDCAVLGQPEPPEFWEEE